MRLSSVETVYAMTIHKSQGSQFDVAAVLLPDAGSRILTRELLYTAVTRARSELILVGSEETVRHAVDRPVARASGLKDPQFVVIDETAGQLITLIGAPLAWKSFLAGFILFRAFDIVKPPPVRQLERLPEGTGIVQGHGTSGIFWTNRWASSTASPPTCSDRCARSALS